MSPLILIFILGLSKIHESQSACLEFGKFLCQDRSTCLDILKVCDDKTDCPDASDEGPGCKIACDNHTCSHLCVPKPDGPRCLCPEMKFLGHDDETCQDYAPLLLFATNSEIRWFEIGASSNDMHVLAQNVSTVAYIAWDKKHVYWSDNEDNTVNSGTPDGKRRSLVNIGLSSPKGIAWDWIGHLVYFVDSVLQHIMACNVSDAVPSICVTVIGGLNEPAAIALDSVNRTMYWTTTGSLANIERAAMDGSQRSIIYNFTAGRPHGLFIDRPTDRLYWSDYHSDAIFNSKMDGTDVKEIQNNFIQMPFSIAVFEDTLYWSDYKTGGIYAADKITGENAIVVIKDLRQPTGINIRHAALNRPEASPCNSKENTICSHVCLLRTVEPGYSCACPLGWMLLPDEHTCEEKTGSHSLLIAKSDGNIGQVFEDYIGNNRVRTIQIPGSTNIVDTAYDPNTNVVVFSASGIGIGKVHLDAPGIEQAVIFPATTGVADHISVDWISGNIYWTMTLQRQIWVGDIDGVCQIMILEHDHASPHEIVVDPPASYLYFISSRTLIFKCEMNGENCLTLIDKAHTLRALTLDLLHQRLYWTNVYLGTLESTLLDGSERTQILLSDDIIPISMAILGEKMYALDKESSSLYILNKTNGKPTLFVDQVDSHTLSPVVYKTSDAGDNGCSRDRGCSHLCLPKSHGVFACHCPANMFLSGDRRTCVIANTCSSGEYSCDGSKCISADLVCNGQANCDDGSDENECSPCDHGSFHCDSGKCIGDNYVCDGFFDCCDSPNNCQDKSDELGCSAENHKVACHSTETRCSDDECIFNDFICDGENDCVNGEDELDCKTSCLPGQFTCTDGSCISMALRCNQEYDCNDKSDETHCRILTCLAREFRCLSGRCVSQDQICDGIHDCDDGEDEGPRAHCKVNECALGIKCSQICEDTEESYVCKCDVGYRLRHDKKGCKAEGHGMKIVFGYEKGIRSLNAVTNSLTVLLSLADDKVISLAVSYFTNHIFYATSRGYIGRVDSVTKKNELLFKSTGVSSIAFDWIGNHMYYTDVIRNGICACSFDGKFCKTIINKDAARPNAIALCPQMGIMFFSKFGDSPTIEKSWMNGSNRQTIIEKDIRQPVDLTVDFPARRLYWLDVKMAIHSSDFSGKNRYVISRQLLRRPSSLSVFEDFIFFTEWNTGTIRRLGKDGHGKEIEIYTHLQRPGPIRILHPSMTPAGPNPCDNAGCPHLCLLSPTGVACACGDSGEIVVDGTVTCLDNLCYGYCKNEGNCSFQENSVICSCSAGFTGTRCQLNSTASDIQEVTTKGSKKLWILGIVVVIIFIGMFTAGFVYYWKNMRGTSDLIGLIRFRNPTICSRSDGTETEELVQDISFGNPAFMETTEDVNSNTKLRSGGVSYSVKRGSVDSAYDSRGGISEFGTHSFPIQET